ncbi:MAG: T9SS type A sorting domain-containing protein [Candidatus Zixiibacteriota bacterium]|nr:MAG: T9SS type A sorting domain-containing protein [candidate division Zixibacteria bacterium]
MSASRNSDRPSRVTVPRPTNGNISGSEGDDTHINIYNLLGKLVKTLKAKEGKTNWDVTNGATRNVSSGIYFVRVVTPGYDTMLKMIYFK